MKKRRLWLIVRISILVFAFFQGDSFITSLTGDFSRAEWPFFFELMAIVAASIFMVVAFQLPSKGSKEKLLRPSWFINPFNVRQHVLVFDFSSYYFLSLGLGSIILGLVNSHNSWAWELPVAIGLGVFFALRAILVIFNDRFEQK